MSGATLTNKAHRSSDRRNLYTTAIAILLGVLGVTFFQAPGGVIGSILGALAGYTLGLRLKPEA